MSPLRISTFCWFAFISCLILVIVSIYEVKWIKNDETQRIPVKLDRPVFVPYGRSVDSGHLQHVFEMFSEFGFVRDSLSNDNWDVLWAHDYPFQNLRTKLSSLKPHQKVNHFPGSGFITNKLDLAMSDTKYIPKAFRIPDQKQQLLHYITDNPKKVFVQKSNDHRGIKVRNVSELDLKTSGTFVQEFIDKPLLIDGHKFDIGVYTVITSIDPLRVYIYNGDILFRFCPDVYYPFDPRNINKYVITDDYLPIWKVPSLKRYFLDLGYSMKNSFDYYMKTKDVDTAKLWKGIEEAIRIVCLQKEVSISRLLGRYASRRNFFEMVRFDFAVDEDLNVFIMEANMSPNLSSAHFPPNRLLYVQVLFNLFSLVGLRGYKRKNRSPTEMEVSLKNVAVFPEVCSSNKCSSCFSPECSLCLSCLTSEAVQYLKESYAEYNRRGDFKRVFPPVMTQAEANKTIKSSEDLSPENMLLYDWFRGKCLLDRGWC